MDPLTTSPAAIPEAQPAPPTISGANGKAAEPISNATVEAALLRANAPPADGVLDIAGMVASYRDGEWYDLSIGGRFRIRRASTSAFLYGVDLEAAYRASHNMAPTDPIPTDDRFAINIKIARDRRITDFDHFRQGDKTLPNRTPDGRFHYENLDLLLSLTPVQGALMVVIRKIAEEEAVAQAAEAGNSPTPSPMN